MKRLMNINYDNVPGLKDAAKIFVKSALRKFYVLPRRKLSRRLVRWRFRRVQRQIARLYDRKQTRIPKIIHYIWVGGNKKPASVDKYIRSWKKYCPDYLIIEWNEKNYDITCNRYTREAYESKKWAFATDFMRLDILDKFGGIYVDTDVEIVKNLDDFLDDPAFTSFEAGDPDQILMPTGLLAAEPGNRWIRFLKTYYDNDRPFILSDGSFDLNANTVTITRMTRQKYKLKMNNKLQKNSDFVIYPSDYFCPKSWSTGKINLTSNSHTIHHFAGSWKKQDPST